jgi:hypothetical protein
VGAKVDRKLVATPDEINTGTLFVVFTNDIASP